MSALTQRLNAVKTAQTSEVMYSAEGAKFQEFAISNLDFKGSSAHKMIGGLVTDINNNRISVNEATAKFIAALSN